MIFHLEIKIRIKMKTILRLILLIGPCILATSSSSIAAPASVKLSLCANSGVIHGSSESYAGDTRKITINLYNSNVQIEGVKNLAHIKYVLVGCASSHQLLNSLGFDVRRIKFIHLSYTITADTVKNLDFSSSINHKNYAYMDLRMQVPESTAVVINSDSGNIAANNLSKLSVKSGSGNITVSHIQGLFSASTSSGNIYAQDLGRVKLGNIGSGAVKILNVSGNIKAKSLGVGNVMIAQVGGNVTLHKTGTGSLLVNNIGGDFTVQHNGGGKIWHANIKGAVSVPQSQG